MHHSGLRATTIDHGPPLATGQIRTPPFPSVLMTRAHRPALWFSLFLALYLAGRILGPDDLNTKDQPKTVAYTIDILQNGHWLWPTDMRGELGRQTTALQLDRRPPHRPHRHLPHLHLQTPLPPGRPRLPRFHGPLRPPPRAPGPASSHPVFPVFWLAALAWLANFTVYGLVSTTRPDMLLAFFLFGGWTIGTLLLEESPFFPGSSSGAAPSGSASWPPC